MTNSERYFLTTFFPSSVQNSVYLAMDAVAEIVVKGCSCVVVLLTTGISVYGSCPLNFNKIGKSSRSGLKCQVGHEFYVGHPWSNCSN